MMVGPAWAWTLVSLLCHSLLGTAFMCFLAWVAQHSVAMAFVPLCLMFAYNAIQPLSPFAAARLLVAYVTLLEVVVWEPLLRTARRLRAAARTICDSTKNIITNTDGMDHDHNNTYEPIMLDHDTGAEDEFVPKALYLYCIHDDPEEEEHHIHSPDGVCTRVEPGATVLRELVYALPAMSHYSEYFTAFWMCSNDEDDLKKMTPRFYTTSTLKMRILGLGQHMRIISARIRPTDESASLMETDDEWVDITDDFKAFAGPLLDFHLDLPVERLDIPQSESAIFHQVCDMDSRTESVLIEVVVIGTRPAFQSKVFLPLKRTNFTVKKLRDSFEDAIANAMKKEE